MNHIKIPPVILTPSLLLAVTVFSSCGTTSELKTTEAAPAIDLSKYTRVVVADFEADATIKSDIPAKIEAYKEEVGIAGKFFADLIANRLKQEHLFDEVSREPLEGEAIVISGAITRYQKGDAAARLFIGLGAGSSYFDANVRFRDNMDQSELGFITVDKNSWGLGGAIAMSQTVEHFMQVGAERIVEEIKQARKAEIQATESL